MKKITSIFLFAVLLLTLALVSCGKPSDMSDAMYQIGLNALSVTDEYISGEITGDDAYTRIEKFYTQAIAQNEKTKNDLGKSSLVGTEYSYDSFVETDIYLIKLKLKDVDRGYDALSKLIEYRDNLAATLGK